MMHPAAHGPQDAPWVVLKFGGTSVASIQRWRIIADTVRKQIDEGLRPLVVCSALAGESDLLEGLIETAESGGDIGPALDEVARTHRALAADMDLAVTEVIGEQLDELERLARGMRMLGEASPRVRARVMSMGELMSTRLGAAWLSAQEGMKASWQDARELLNANSDPHVLETAPARHYLSATCSSEYDPALASRLATDDADVWLTQGFIASDAAGDTVLLGRGGSDTSAAYFAARLGARALQIWTDVPGMFSSNPRAVPQARLLRRLHYREAQELALMGGSVLHFRCIAPVAAHHIPLYIKCTLAPDMIGTAISSSVPKGAPRVKAVSLRKGMHLLSVEPHPGRQNVGFVAEAAACFARWNLSIDMIAAAETSVTFTLDPRANRLDDNVMTGLLADLRAHVGHSCVLGRGAALSLVGTNIHGLFHELGPIFEHFEEHDVYMVSQAADGSNFTVLVGEERADRLLAELHGRLFPADLDDPAFGPPWDSLFTSGVNGTLARIRR